MKVLAASLRSDLTYELSTVSEYYEPSQSTGQLPYFPSSSNLPVSVQGRSPRHDRHHLLERGQRWLVAISSILSSFRTLQWTLAQIWGWWDSSARCRGSFEWGKREVHGIKVARDLTNKEWSSKPQPVTWGWCLQTATCLEAHRISVGELSQRVWRHEAGRQFLLPGSH